MTPTPPSVASSQSAGHSPDVNFRVVRKRNRVPLSCAPCRHRKLKCNRALPCDNCTKRGDSHSCSYAAPAARKKGTQSHTSASRTPDDMQNRIDRLEGLVLSLMTNGGQAPGAGAAANLLSATGSISNDSYDQQSNDLDQSPMIDDDDEEGRAEDSDTEKVTKSFGIMKVDSERQKMIYIGEAHWAALLNEIGEVRNYFSTHRKEYDDQMEKISQARKEKGAVAGSGPALLFGASIPPSRADIISQIPSRYMSDILVGRYFNTFDPATHILHGPTFQKQYHMHWMDPSQTSIVWIGMLFAMLRLAMLSYAREGDEPPEFRGKCKDLANTFRTQVAHCLITADYTKPHVHLIETLIFHLHGEYTINRDAEASVWVLVGMIARLAMRMGYHRDSKLFPNITPFQGEMRRRIWTFVRQADLLFSFQMALPSMIRIGDSDTDLPRNIYDDEFDEECTALPPARPSTEATPVSYMIAKGKLAFGFGRVLEEINGVHRKGYDEVLKIDRGLREIYDSIPEHLRLRPMSEQNLAPISLIMARFGLATIYHKSMCVLHRRFLKLSGNSARYVHSRRTCLDSAMQLLSFQAIQHQESRDRGRLRSLRNYINSLTSHDFLLAATVVCTDLYNHRERPDFDANTPSTSVSGQSGSAGSSSIDGAYLSGSEYRRDDLIRALDRSRDIWFQMRDESMEAYKASELLKLLVENYQKSGDPLQPTGQYPPVPVPANGAINDNDERSAAMTLGLLQSGGMTPNPQGLGNGQQAQRNYFDGKGGMDNLFAAGAEQQLTGAFGGGAQNAPSPFTGVFGGPMNDLGSTMNFDWDTWDQYMQPSNMSLDPAANLWSSNSPTTNNQFSSASSPTNATDNVYGGINASFFPPPSIGGVMGNGAGPALSTTTVSNESNNNGGEVFMGVASPQPGGVPGWKWNTTGVGRKD